MVFASGIFLFLFLPITFIGYYMLKSRPVIWKNIFLLLMSIGFYLRSGLKELLLLFLSIIVNYFFALMIAGTEGKRKKCFLCLAVVYNIGMLFIFKYLSFVTTQVGSLIPGLETALDIALPLGISFYTFQALSYVIDVYRRPELVEKNIFNVALYISFFPQLVAGPIVRWESIRNDLRKREGGGVNAGLERLAIGLGKKVIIANQMAVFADKAFDLLGTGNLTVGFSWIGAIAYTFQIYYDFSGYSDMAIGLGQIFGFTFPENFNYPYIAKSVTEFWRRWHISLSSWFRDYVYIPLGGNRCSYRKMYFNLFVVWICTGFWHGANYTFWLWGLIYFAVLVTEKVFAGPQKEQKSLKVWSGILGHVYTIFVVVLLWVLFRADSVGDAINYMTHMFGKGSHTEYAIGVTRLYFTNSIGYFCLAFIGCMPWMTFLKRHLKLSKKSLSIARQAWIIAVFVIACCVTIDSNYNPFIYFNF